MADLIQLDKAAAMVGKSEVTLRRLIKAGKVPFHKEKTLTGFVYRVDPKEVRAYYQLKGGVADPEESVEEEEKPERPTPSYMPKSPEPVRIAVEDEGGHAGEYWRKRSDLYEDRYNQEIQKHAHTREELGMWRGRAEQAQSMIIKMLPAPETPAIAPGQAVAAGKPDTVSWFTVALASLVTVVVLGGIGAYVYVRYYVK